METEALKPVRRGSKQKSVVLRTVKNMCNHPTAQDVFFRAREEVSNISFSTVYRNLAILVEDGVLITVAGTGSEVHYDHVLENHNHVQCRICGKVRDIQVPPMDYKGIALSETSGFTVDGVCVTFTGTCRECREKLLRKENIYGNQRNAD
ncbi:MAG: transcriptional repressor [Candidatus Fermentibacteraceae bacterium]|nr:transcriptional repressor [Candidatus Fermentibacteraceae bacterium]